MTPGNGDHASLLNRWREHRTVLICGSRTWTEADPINAILEAYRMSTADLTVLHGAAKGADSLAGFWGHRNADEVAEYPARWDTHGRSAGPMRNQEMLDKGQPDVVWAFIDKPLSESKGTADMVRRASKAGVPTYVVQAVSIARDGAS